MNEKVNEEKIYKIAEEMAAALKENLAEDQINIAIRHIISSTTSRRTDILHEIDMQRKETLEKADSLKTEFEELEKIKTDLET